MENQLERINCKICGCDISTKRFAITRHVKKHNLTLNDYLKKYYKQLSNEESCGFCNRDAIPIYEIDHMKMEYKLSYNGYFCGEESCKKDISLSILGIEYDPKKYEKIGSKKEYLSKLYKISIDDAIDMKYNKPEKKFKCTLEEFQNKYGIEDGKFRYEKRLNGIIKNHAGNKFPCTLENFINKYGVEIGTIKYNSRCEKISYTSSIDFFIDKYGVEKGNIIWKNKFKNANVSKSSQIINKILNQLNINYVTEKSINGKFVDYYIEEYNMAIEYFGDYWHMNPKRYTKDYYNTRKKTTAQEIWDFDKNRLNFIHEKVNTIIVIWEGTKIDISLLEKTINDLKNKKTIIYL